MEQYTGFLLLGMVILVSVVGNRLYEKTGLPESLFMIILGVFSGPVTNIIPPSSLAQVINYIFTVSLIVIILESGISTEISDAFNSMKHASLFTVLILFMSMGICGGILYFFFNWNITSSIIMGIICSGTSTLPVIYMVERINVVEKVKSLLTFESIFNDITLLTALTLTLETFSFKTSIFGVLSNLVKHVSEPIIYGSFMAFIWAYLLLGYFRNTHVKYISTLAISSILYAYTEAERGSGVLAILVFSILLGNLPKLARSSGVFSKKILEYLDELENELIGIRGIQTEMSFLAKNFFFFIMGILFDVTRLNTALLIITISLITSIFISRYFTAWLISRLEPGYHDSLLVIAIMLPRGLTASIASYMPQGNQAVTPMLVEVTLLMVIITNIFTIFFSFVNRFKNDAFDSMRITKHC